MGCSVCVVRSHAMCARRAACLRCWALDRILSAGSATARRGHGNVAIILQACAGRGCARFEEQGQATPTLRRLTKTKGKFTNAINVNIQTSTFKFVDPRPPTALRSLGITPQRTCDTVIIVLQLAARHLTRPIAAGANKEVLPFAFLVDDVYTNKLCAPKIPSVWRGALPSLASNRPRVRRRRAFR